VLERAGCVDDRRARGDESIRPRYLAGALLIGLTGNAIAGAWWLDPLVGLIIVGVVMKEGLEARRGDGCCVGSPVDGFAVGGAACQRDCCR